MTSWIFETAGAVAPVSAVSPVVSWVIMPVQASMVISERISSAHMKASPLPDNAPHFWIASTGVSNIREADTCKHGSMDTARAHHTAGAGRT